ncbi:hypothetical protein [Pseudomonas akapageensis]|uniref:hypothetical protein n=1 Tax=Pseudomonas akapageensis TaxID=2609961 RepID=UPI00140D74BA|nr:hypothetical protein [Pseudomonas akapageensis]
MQPITSFSVSILLMSILATGETNDFSGEYIHIENISTFHWPGQYAKKSELCTFPNNGESCLEQFRDFLKIESVRQGFLVELHSTQADQHVCSFLFRMDSVGEALIHKTQFGSVLIQRNGNFLEISSKGVDPTALGMGVCGARADIDGLRFPLSGNCNDGCSKND